MSEGSEARCGVLGGWILMGAVIVTPILSSSSSEVGDVVMCESSFPVSVRKVGLFEPITLIESEGVYITR